MNRYLSRALPLLLLSAAACKTREIPRPEAPWMPLGGKAALITLLDTSRIVHEGNARLVRLRVDSIATGPGGNPVFVTSARRESAHRVHCATRTVDDLPLPGQATTPTQGVAFEGHPYGPRVFPSVCSAMAVVARVRAAEKD